MEDEDQGSLPLGIVLGFFLGLIGVLLAFVQGRSRTMIGSVVGAVLQLLTCGCLGGVVSLAWFQLSTAGI